MSTVKIDFSKVIGKIKPVHGVGQPPLCGRDSTMMRYLSDAGIPYSRLHDVGGAYGGFRWVDVPNIFRDFDADETLEESYDFTFTDILITALMDFGIEPYFRLGVTIENDSKIKSYRITPPSDYGKWARICEHIIRHYTEGWANGFNYKIEYWEIWNEPDSKPDPLESMMWKGTPEEYFVFYDVASKHLKACFPHLKIGGYAACGFYGIHEEKRNQPENRERFLHYLDFFEKFLVHIKESGAPLDYFSWHIYDSDMKRVESYINFVREQLDKYGFTNTESSCNEWNLDSGERGTFLHAAKTAAALLLFQNTTVDNAMFYDARFGSGRYSGIFNPETARPYPAYYAFTAFNRLYKLENQVECSVDNDCLFAVAAAKGNKGCLVIANTSDTPVSLDFEVNGTQIIALLTSECKGTAPGALATRDPKCDSAVASISTIPEYSILTVLYDI